MTEPVLVGFTGSRTPASPEQEDWVERALRELYASGSWLLHGDCLGKDEFAHEVGRALGYRVKSFPPLHDRWRAYLDADLVVEPASYLVRNRGIVDAATVVVACPDDPETLRSGTWATIRYARRVARVRRLPIRVFTTEVPVPRP